MTDEKDGKVGYRRGRMRKEAIVVEGWKEGYRGGRTEEEDIVGKG